MAKDTKAALGNTKAVSVDTRAVSALLQAALARHRAGDFAAARKLCEQVLRGHPGNANALHLLGLTFIERGMTEKGFQLLFRAVAASPRSVGVLNDLAVELCRAGRITEGLARFDALAGLRDAPAAVHHNRARALRDAGRGEDALGAYEAAIALEPFHPAALADRGAVLAELGRLPEAVAASEQAIAVMPSHEAAHVNRVRALRALDAPKRALDAADAAIAAGCVGAELSIERGHALSALGRHREAACCYEAGLTATPEDAYALNGLGVGLRALGQPEAALARFDAALLARPAFAEALDNRGCALLDLGRHEAAAGAFAELLALRPDHPYAAGHLLRARLGCADWDGTASLSRAVSDAVAAGAGDADEPFGFLAHQADATLQLRCASAYVARNHPSREASPPPRRARGGRIRLAYISADFRAHPVALLMAGVFERHDRARFEVVGLSLRPAEDSDIGRRVAASFDRHIDISGMSDAEVVVLARDLGIDIAIDLMGHTAQSRPGILAGRAAPVQVNYLGYPGTMGADYIDAIIADAFVIPPGSERFHAERVIRLPRCFQASDDRRHADAAPTRRAAGLPGAGLVFGAFSNTMKLNPQMFDVWMRLLRAVPESVLWLYADDPAARANLAREAAAREVAPERLVFASRVPYAAHLGRLRLTDLFLDTFPFNGGATVGDALWAGVPVVSRAGQAFASRMAGSLLTAIGMPGLIASDFAEYEAIALKLATDPVALADARAGVERGGPGLFDTAAFGRDLETALGSLVTMPE